MTVPFLNEYVYLTIDCKDECFLDDVRLEIRASTHVIVNHRKKKADSDEEGGEDKYANPVKKGLQAFITQTNDHIQDLIHDPTEWRQYQASHLANTSGHSKAPTLNAVLIDELFLTAVQGPIELHQEEALADQMKKNRQEVLKSLLDEGDYVAHNKLDVSFS